MYKTTSLERSNITSIVGAVANDYDGQVAIVPATKRGMSNTTVSSGSGEYDGGDRVIGYNNGYEIDGDLLFTVGWGDGFAVRRLNNDGTMTRLFYDNNFLWRDTTSTYNHLTSVAIDKTNKIGVVMTYNVEGYTTFDYSGCTNGGTTFVKDPRPTHSNPDFFIGSQDTGGGYVNRVGGGYYSGLAAAGEWIYAGDHDAHHYKKVMRKNINTGVEERLSTTDTNVMYPGSAAEDRNGYRGKCYYDEINDRIMYGRFYNANFILVLDASTSSPKTVWCDMADAGQGDDGYEHGWFIPDPVNEPNVFYIGTNSRFSKVDITPCLSGNTATVLKQVFVNGTVAGNNYSVEMRAGTKYQSATNGEPTDKMPGHPNFMPTSSDRGRAMIPGWIDQDNDVVVALYRYNNTTEDTTSLGRGRSYRSDYGNNLVRMYSANGTPWWIQTGYGYDGHGFKIWSDTYRNELIENWTVQYGTYSLDNSADIDFVYWNQEGYYTPSNCSLSFFVSNNNGSTWESYTGSNTAEHNFTSTGNQLLCKIQGNGTVSKNAYKMSNTKDSITFGTKYAAEMDASIHSKMTRFKLKGKKYNMATVTGTRRLLDISGNNISTAVSLEAEGTLLDSNGQSGTSNQVLISTATGVDWVDGSGSGIIGGPYLPLSAGSGEILTGDLAMNNNIGIITKDSTGSFRDVLKLNSTNVLEIGSSALATDTIFKNTGNVGIGTTSPTADLHIQGSSETDVPILRVGGFGNSGSKLELAETLTSGAMNYGFSFFNDGNSSNTLIIKAHNNSTTGVTAITINRTNSQTTFSTVPVVGTRTAGDNSTYAASTAFVTAAIAAAPQGTVTSVTATAPILSSGGATPIISARVPASGDWWNGGLTQVQTDGVMEVGKYIDMHATDTATSDFDVRLTASTGSLNVSGDIVIGGGDITLSGTGRIQGVDTVSAGTDAANKTYVDNAVAGVPQGDITAVTAGTFLTGGGTSGDVTLNADASKLAHIVDSSNGSVTSGWITVAQASGSRKAGEVYVTDGESSDHSYIRIEWMRSYADSNFTVLNCGGHANRIQGVRVLEDTSDKTYGKKYLQVKVTATSNYYVIVTAPGTIPNYDDFIAETPVLENSKTGYNIKGNTLEDLQNSSIGSEQGITSGGNIELNDARYVFTKGDILSLSAGGAGSGTEIVLDDAGSVIKLNSDTIAKDTFIVSSLTDGTGDDVFIANSNLGTFTLGDTAGIGDEALITGDTSSIYIKTNGTSSLIADSSNDISIPNGNVGIGTTSPTHNLHIASDAPVIRLQDNTSSDNHYLNGNNGEFRIQTTGFLTLRPGNTESVRFLANGNVGIGTTSPGVKLVVNGGGDNEIAKFVSTDSVSQISISDDTTTSYFGSKDGLSFISQTGGTPGSGLVLDSAGNVGIGTTSPSSKLEVSGNSLVTGTQFIGDTFTKIQQASGNLLLTNQSSSGAITFLTNNTERIRINSSGNLGIGTTSPGQKLDVNGSVNIDGTLFVNTTNNHIRLVDTDNTGNFSVGVNTNFQIRDITANTTPLTIRAGTPGNTILTTSTGRVGIGLTNPTVTLHVGGFARLNGGLQMNATNATIYQILDSDLRFGTNNTERMRIDNTGNVGIGTTTPGDKLHVNGTIRVQAPASTDWALLGYNSAGSAASGLWFANGDGELLLRDDSSNLNVRLRSDASSYINGGSLGLGTTSPNLKLDVISGTNNGIRISATDTTSNWRDIDIRSYVSQAQANALPDGSAIYTTNPTSQTETAFSKFGGLVLQGRDDGNSSFAIRLGNGNGYATRMFMGATGATVFSNTVTATNFILSSDERLKENVKKVCDNRVKADWKTFELKADKGQKRYGVIAQELEKTNPEFVREDSEGFKSVAYIDLLIAKIAELEARLEKLEK